VEQAADRVTDVILRSTRYEMLHNDREALYNIIRELGSQPGIQRIRIFNKDAASRFRRRARSRYGGEQERRGLLRVPRAIGAARQVNRPDRARMFWDKQGTHLLAVIRPIDNSPACSDAACHATRLANWCWRDRRGSFAGDRGRPDAQHQATLAWFLVGAVLFGSLAAVAFIWVVVYRPVKKLIGRHPSRGRRGPGVSPASGLGRRIGRSGALVQPHDRRGGGRSGQNRRRGAPQDGRARERA